MLQCDRERLRPPSPPRWAPTLAHGPVGWFATLFAPDLHHAAGSPTRGRGHGSFAPALRHEVVPIAVFVEGCNLVLGPHA